MSSQAANQAARSYRVDRPSALGDHLRGQERMMDVVNLADAKARLSELVDRVEAGYSIDLIHFWDKK